MKAIILAAGEGKRLRPLTESKPKCLINLFGKSILQRQIETLKKCNINDISIVIGYLGEKIKIPDVTYFHNFNYNTTNMLETLFCAREKLSDSVIISYGDIVFEKSVLEKLINSQNDISITIDINWENYWRKRFGNPLSDAESLKLDKNNYITEIGQKVEKIEEIKGQFIGLMQFQNKGITLMKDFYDKCKIASKNGCNPLNSSIQFEESYMTDFLQGMIKEGNLLKSIPTSNRWLELDSIEDYQLYEEMFNDNTISKFFSPMM